LHEQVIGIFRSYFFGHISPRDTPNDYIDLIKKLFAFYSSECHEDGPLVINQQGWVKGNNFSK